MVDIVGKHLKSAVANVVKEIKKNIRTPYYQMENIHIASEILKRIKWKF